MLQGRCAVAEKDCTELQTQQGKVGIHSQGAGQGSVDRNTEGPGLGLAKTGHCKDKQGSSKVEASLQKKLREA